MGGGAESPAPQGFAAWWARQRWATLSTLFVGVVVAVVGAAVGGVFSEDDSGDTVAASSPRPSPSCFYETCTGGDANLTRCGAQAVTLAQEWHGTMTVEVRYSARCRAVWARTQGARVGDTVEISAASGRRQRASVLTDHDKYTPMLAVGPEFSVRAVAVSVRGNADQHIPAGYELQVGADERDIPPAATRP